MVRKIAWTAQLLLNAALDSSVESKSNGRNVRNGKYYISSYQHCQVHENSRWFVQGIFSSQ